MQSKKRLVITIFALAIGVVFAAIWATAQSNFQAGTLAWHAQKARAAGQTEAIVPWPQILTAGFVSLDDAFVKTTVIVARLEYTKTTHDEKQIVTWSKYRLLEKLSSQATVPAGPLPDDVPASLLPLDADEFLVPTLGGTAVVDGISVTLEEPGAQKRSVNDRHLMFALFRCSGKVALLNYGTAGLFILDASDGVHPFGDPERSRVWHELSRNNLRDLPALRSLAVSRIRKP